jgi:hypothetical protein
MISSASRSIIRSPFRTFCQAAAAVETSSGLPQIFAKLRDSGEGSRASRKIRKGKKTNPKKTVNYMTYFM